MKTLITTSITAWSAFLLLHGYYFLLGKWETPHPSFVPLLIFVFVQGMAILLAVAWGIVRILRGPKRLESAAWALLAVLPVFIWYSQVSIGMQIQRELRERPPTPSWYLLSVEPIANAIIDGLARYQLPHRLEGKRAVMFYDDRIDQPEADLAAFDLFLEDEEKYLGRTMPGKLHWIRGTVMGFSGNALTGVAIADPELRHDELFMEAFPYKELQYVDYHEAAHGVISTPTVYSAWRGTAPPVLLVEGWPEARSKTWENLVYHCHHEKRAERTSALEELVSPQYYFCADYRVYQQGGALVSVLLKHFGPEKFRELYYNCSQKTFADDVKRVYNMTLDELDAFYWKEIDDCYSFEKATEHLSPEEKTLLAEFRAAYDHQMATYQKLLSNCTVQSTTHISIDVTGDEPRKVTEETETHYYAKDGTWFRFEETDKSNTNGESFERSKISMQTPELRYFAYQSSGTEKHPPRSETTCNMVTDEKETWQIVRSNLSEHLPYSVFKFYPTFLNDYLWFPPKGITVESVTREDDQVVITIRAVGTIQLHLAPDRHWSLLKATMSDSNDKIGSTNLQTEVREFEGEWDGVPLLKKRTTTREYVSEKASSHFTQTLEITHFDQTPAEASLFAPDLIPQFKDVEPPQPPTITRTPEERLNRHLVVIALWLLLSVVGIARSRMAGHAATR
jgi:hypothetical protein